MPAINLPSSINQPAWDKKAGKNDKAGVGEKLKDLAKLHMALDLSFADKLDKPEDVEAAKAKLEAIAKKQGPELQAAAREAAKAAKKNDNSATAKEAAAIAKDAEAYAIQVEKALANARTSIDKRASEVAAEAKKAANAKGGKKDAKEDEEAEDEGEQLASEKDDKKFRENLKKSMKTWLTKLQNASKSMPPEQLVKLRAGESKVGMAKFRMQTLGKQMGIAIAKNAGEGERKLAMRMAGIKGGGKDAKGFMYWDPELKLFVLEGPSVAPGAANATRLKMEMKKILGYGPKLCLQRPGQKGEASEGPEEADPDAGVDDASAPPEAKEAAKTAATPEAKSAANQATDELKAFDAEAKKRLESIKPKLQSLDAKSMAELKNLARVVQDKGKKAETLIEAKSALNRIMALAEGGAAGGQVPPKAPPTTPQQGAAAGASPALVQASTAWTADVTKFRTEVRKLLGSLDEIYREEPEQKAAVDSAKKALDAAVGKVNDNLDKVLAAFLRANPQQRAQLVPRVRSEVQSVRQALASDKVLAALDGNELNPSLVVVAPMRQRLQAIEAALA